MSTKRKALPKGIAAGEFDKAIKELKAILGDEHVLVDEVRLAPYNKIMMPVPMTSTRHRPPSRRPVSSRSRVC
jgi:4-cresol dehydrogenase (hydroxylating)